MKPNHDPWTPIIKLFEIGIWKFGTASCNLTLVKPIIDIDIDLAFLYCIFSFFVETQNWIS